MEDHDRLEHCLGRESKRINGDRGGGREDGGERERDVKFGNI